MKGMLRSGSGLLCGLLLAQPSAPRIEKKVALVIGNDLYQHVTPLRTATNDARSVQAILQGRYSFETTLLLNATRSQIVSALNSYRRDLGADSSLLIYYAGHGYYDRAVDKAYWWPVDAKDNDNTDWISADDITTNIKGIASRHVLIVSDSCFSGTLSRGVMVPQNLNGLSSDRARALLRLEQRPSRELMASGGDEPVSDGGAGGHSVFAGAFLRALENMQEPQFAAEELFQEVRTSVAGNSAQLPQFDPLRNSGDDGGSFVFSRVAGTAAVVRPSPPPARTGEPARRTKAVKDTGEYGIYIDVIKDSDVKSPNYGKLLTDLDTWAQKYPTSDYKDERDAFYVQAYGGTGQPGKALDVVKGLIAGGMPGIKERLTNPTLIVITLYAAVTSAAQACSTGSPTPDQLDTGAKAAHALLDYSKEWFVPANKSPGVADDQWAAGLKQMQDAANGAQLQIALYPGLSILGVPPSKDPATCARAEGAFTKALQDRPDSGLIAAQLANTLLCQQRLSVDKLQQAVFEYARAVVSPQGLPFGLDAAKQKSFDDYLTRAYTTLHGNNQGLAELKDLARRSPFPPAGFKVKTAGEIASEEQAKFQRDDPQLAMWMSVEGLLSGDGGPAFFEASMKDADVRGQNGSRALKGKVVGMLSHLPNQPATPATCNPNELLVAINLPNQTGDVAKVKLHLSNWALRGKVENGAEIQWDGVPRAFTKNPFLLTMEVEDKTRMDVAITPCNAGGR